MAPPEAAPIAKPEVEVNASATAVGGVGTTASGSAEAAGAKGPEQPTTASWQGAGGAPEEEEYAEPSGATRKRGLRALSLSTRRARAAERRAAAGLSEPEQFAVHTPSTVDVPPASPPRVTSPGSRSYAARVGELEKEVGDMAEDVHAQDVQISVLAAHMQISEKQVELLSRDLRGDHERHLTSLESLERTVRDEVIRLEKLIDLKAKSGNGGEREKLAMVHRRGLSDVPKLSGEVAGYVDWCFKMKGFVRAEPGFEQFLENLDTIGSEPDVRAITAYGVRFTCDSAWFDEQLYGLLVNWAEEHSKALSVTKNCLDLHGCRGALSWYRVALGCKGGKGQMRMDTLREAARHPTACANFSEALARIADWDSAVRTYAKEFPAEKISEYEKGNILKDMLPVDLVADVVKLEKRGYDQIYEYATTQIPLRMEEEMRRKGK